jgi:methyl-accepting chemotaxis protein
MAPEFILNLKRFLGSAPRLTGLLRNQLDETNRISAEFAISVLTQISSVQIQASHLLSSLTDVRSQTASMCDQAQKSIESSKRKLQEMSEYTTSREAKLRDDSEAIQQVVTLMKDLLPLTSLIGTLSKQTRLLALNAAIQAANDHTVGRGFVAVADEMRKLALQIDSTSAQVDGVMRRVTRITEDKLLEMVSVNRIQTEKNWLHTLTDSMTQMSQQFQAAVFGLDRLSRDSHEAVQTIFNAVLKAQETAQFQDISRQQIELVQHGLDLCGDRLSSAGDLLSETANDRPLSIEPLEDLLRTLEDRYSMQSQQTIHDRALSNKSDDGRGKEPIVELF